MGRAIQRNLCESKAAAEPERGEEILQKTRNNVEKKLKCKDYVSMCVCVCVRECVCVADKRLVKKT